MFVDLSLVLPENFIMDVKQHSYSQQELVVVAVKMLSITLLQETLCVIFLLLCPGRPVWNRTSARVLGLLSLPTPRDGRREAGVALGDLGAAELLGCDEVPHEGLDVLVPGVPLKTVHQRESDGVLKVEKLFVKILTPKKYYLRNCKRKSVYLRKG